MKFKRLSSEFFDRPTIIVAQELLGKFLIRKIGNKSIAVMITETEAYIGPNDLASHASRGKTPRTEVMFGPPGHAYVYMIYGMYHCLNIVTEQDGYPAALLIRGAILESGRWKVKSRIIGPGRICKFLEIDKKLNKEDLTTSRRIWIEDRGIKIKPRQVKKTKRIGIDYAGKYKDKLWRFVIE